MANINLNGYEDYFESEEGKLALKALERYGVEDLTPYEPWQIEYYVESATPWPECCRLFKKHASYCAKHGDVGFDEWLEEINNDPAQNDEDDDFDYSMYDKYTPPKVNYSCGEAMDRELDFNGDPVPVDC